MDRKVFFGIIGGAVATVGAAMLYHQFLSPLTATDNDKRDKIQNEPENKPKPPSPR